MIATPARGRHQVLAQMPPKGLQDRMRLALSLHGLGQMAVEAPDTAAPPDKTARRNWSRRNP
jgi:hypothetical protein